MGKIICKRKRTFLMMLVISVAVIGVLAFSLQSDEEEDTYEDMFNSRSGKRTSSSPHGRRIDSAKKGTGRKLQNGSVKENHHNREMKNVGGKKSGPENQKWKKRKNGLPAKHNGRMKQNNSVKSNRQHRKTIKERERMSTISVSHAPLTTQSVMVTGMDTNISLNSVDKQKVQATKLRVAYVENRYRGSFRRRFQDSNLCHCGLDINVVVGSEEDPSNLSDHDILIFVQDMEQKPLTPPVWRDIVSSAKEDQRRVYASIESSPKVRHLVPSVPNSLKTFHWSMTYHSKSDIPKPYGRYEPLGYVRETKNRDRNWAEGKTNGVAAWMSHDKKTTWDRDGFIQSLQVHFEVDLYGPGYRICGRDSHSCAEEMKKYKFYLAIEGSCCSEYITETFWRSFSWNVVPIVVGPSKEDYLRLAPPNSFIYADDFLTAEDLADYLSKLDNTDEFYNDYFQWRQEGEVAIDSSAIKGTSMVGMKMNTESSLYTCETVCRVAKKYVNEKSMMEKKTYDGSYFDPRAPWWGQSCWACGSHPWISQFSIKQANLQGRIEPGIVPQFDTNYVWERRQADGAF